MQLDAAAAVRQAEQLVPSLHAQRATHMGGKEQSSERGKRLGLREKDWVERERERERQRERETERLRD